MSETSEIEHRLGMVGRFSPYFVVEVPDHSEPWRPLRSLMDGSHLAASVQPTATAMGLDMGRADDLRVATSTFVLSLAARVISPVIGGQLLGVDVPAPDLDDWWWLRRGERDFALGTHSQAEPAPAADAIEAVLKPLGAAITSWCGLSHQVIEGNIAGACFGAATVIGHSDPDLGKKAHAIAVELLAGPLAGAGRMEPDFVRNSCCLYYRVAPGSYCGNCVIRPSD